MSSPIFKQIQEEVESSSFYAIPIGGTESRILVGFHNGGVGMSLVMREEGQPEQSLTVSLGDDIAKVLGDILYSFADRRAEQDVVERIGPRALN